MGVVEAMFELHYNILDKNPFSPSSSLVFLNKGNNFLSHCIAHFINVGEINSLVKNGQKSI